jgi:hypothetical protein
MTAETKVERVQEFISHIYNVFEKRPGMLGKPAELPAILWIVDSINNILHRDATDENKSNRTWENFLIEKKLLIGADNKLAKILSDDDFDFSYLQELRREYCEWKEKP